MTHTLGYLITGVGGWGGIAGAWGWGLRVDILPRIKKRGDGGGGCSINGGGVIKTP